MIKAILAGIAIREGILQLNELQERNQIFNQAREYADSQGKPLLVVGTPKHTFSHPYGDVTIDTDPRKMGQGNTEIADVREIPYPNHYFGAAYCSHVLEHLPAIEDACQALDEMERVADKVFTVSPHKASLMAQIYPGHNLWITPSGDGYIIEQRGQGRYREEAYTISMQVL